MGPTSKFTQTLFLFYSIVLYHDPTRRGKRREGEDRGGGEGGGYISSIQVQGLLQYARERENKPIRVKQTTRNKGQH